MKRKKKAIVEVKRGRGRPRKDPNAVKRFSVLCYTTPGIWHRLKLLSIGQHTSMSAIASEAILTWIKWIRKAELEELTNEKAIEATQKELQEIQTEIGELPHKKRVSDG